MFNHLLSKRPIKIQIIFLIKIVKITRKQWIVLSPDVCTRTIRSQSLYIRQVKNTFESPIIRSLDNGTAASLWHIWNLWNIRYFLRTIFGVMSHALFLFNQYYEITINCYILNSHIVQAAKQSFVYLVKKSEINSFKLNHVFYNFRFDDLVLYLVTP